MRRIVALSVLSVAVALAAAGAAQAHAPCGRDGSRHACRVAGNRTVRGTLPVGQGFYERWFVFRVRSHTRVRLTIQDAENPSCDTPVLSYCSGVRVDLLDARGDELRESALTIIRNGVSVSRSVSARVGAGIYYAEVGGYDEMKAPLPFALTVRGSPAVLR